MLVLLDDLDRCLPENVIALIEAVKLYLSEQEGMPVVFLWAMDRDIITESIGAKYNMASFTGRDYLEKIFDFQIPVPRLSVEGTRSLIQGLYDFCPYKEGLKVLLGDDPIGFLSKELDVLPLRNPRTLNRVWSMPAVLAARPEEFRDAAGKILGEQDSQVFRARLMLGLIIAYSFRKWRFEVLHNRDTWKGFLGRCKGELPDSQEYLTRNHNLCLILSTKLRRKYEALETPTGSCLKLDLLESNLEELYGMSTLLQNYAC